MPKNNASTSRELSNEDLSVLKEAFPDFDKADFAEMKKGIRVEEVVEMKSGTYADIDVSGIPNAIIDGVLNGKGQEPAGSHAVVKRVLCRRSRAEYKNRPVAILSMQVGTTFFHQITTPVGQIFEFNDRDRKKLEAVCHLADF